MNLYSTKPLLKKLKLNSKELNDFSDLKEKDFHSYHATFFKVNRQNSILITHNITLYSFWIIGVLAEDFERIQDFISQSIFRLLRCTIYKQQEIEKVLAGMNEIAFFQSADKSVISTMNHMQTLIKQVYYPMGEQDVYKINRMINEMPLKPCNFSSPHELFTSLLKK